MERLIKIVKKDLHNTDDEIILKKCILLNILNVLINIKKIF